MSNDLYYLDYSGLQTFSMPSPLRWSNAMSCDSWYDDNPEYPYRHSLTGTITVEGRNRLRAAIKAILREAQIDFIMKELNSVRSHSNQSDASYRDFQNDPRASRAYRSVGKAPG